MIFLGAAYGKNVIEKLVKIILKEKGDLKVNTRDIIDGNILLEKKMSNLFLI